eukprot:TRINITY_DN13084_c0_g1_i1.p1 TRINITY_DN13084_c0_g1~~TRINITY_DN13084_c0_g1_i1.p1  ORF type:complete len:515 (+),score=117.43 TRINITY_DN13084_c0_g1_i1:68-1546(+)
MQAVTRMSSMAGYPGPQAGLHAAQSQRPQPWMRPAASPTPGSPVPATASSASHYGGAPRVMAVPVSSAPARDPNVASPPMSHRAIQSCRSTSGLGSNTPGAPTPPRGRGRATSPSAELQELPRSSSVGNFAASAVAATATHGNSARPRSPSASRQLRPAGTGALSPNGLSSTASSVVARVAAPSADGGWTPRPVVSATVVPTTSDERAAARDSGALSARRAPASVHAADADVDARDFAAQSAASASAAAQAELRAAEARYAELQAQYADLQAKFAELQAKQGERERQLQTREEELATQTASLRSQEQRLSAREEEFATKEAHVFSQQQALSAREERLALRETAVGEREVTIAKREQAVNDREVAFLEESKQCKRREDEREDDLRRRSEEVYEFANELKEQDSQLKERRRQLEEREIRWREANSEAGVLKVSGSTKPGRSRMGKENTLQRELDEQKARNLEIKRSAGRTDAVAGCDEGEASNNVPVTDAASES